MKKQMVYNEIRNLNHYGKVLTGKAGAHIKDIYYCCSNITPNDVDIHLKELLKEGKISGGNFDGKYYILDSVKEPQSIIIDKREDRIAKIKEVMNSIKFCVEELKPEYVKWGATENDIVRVAQAQDEIKLSYEEIKEILEKLRMKGEIYCPKKDYYQITREI